MIVFRALGTTRIWAAFAVAGLLGAAAAPHCAAAQVHFHTCGPAVTAADRCHDAAPQPGPCDAAGDCPCSQVSGVPAPLRIEPVLVASAVVAPAVPTHPSPGKAPPGPVPIRG